MYICILGLVVSDKLEHESTRGGTDKLSKLRNYHMTILHSSLHKYIHIVRELHCILRYICIYT